MKRRTVVALVGLSLLVLAVAAYAEKGDGKGKRPTMVAGVVASVDQAAGTVTIKGKDGDQTLAVGDKTEISKAEEAKLEDLTAGATVRVMGKPSEDKSSVEAKIILLLSTDAAAGKRGRGLAGKLNKDGDQLSVTTADGNAVKIVVSAETKVAKEVNIALSDVKEGARLRGLAADKGGALQALKLMVLSGELRGDRGGKGAKAGKAPRKNKGKDKEN